MNTLERVFECYVVLGKMKVKLVSKHLRGRASDRLEQLQDSRKGRGKGKIRECEKNKKTFKEQFLAFPHFANVGSLFIYN